MKNGFRVIDADAHTQDNLSHWVDYFEPEFWDRRPRIEYVEEDQAFGTMTARVLPCELFPQPGGAGQQPAGRELQAPGPH